MTTFAPPVVAWKKWGSSLYSSHGLKGERAALDTSIETLTAAAMRAKWARLAAT